MKVNIILNMIKLYHIDRRNHSELWNIGVILTNIRNKQRWLLPPLFCNVLLEILTTVLYESEIRVKTIRKVETKLSLFANDRINLFRQRVQTRTCGINKKIQQNIWLKDQYPEAIVFIQLSLIRSYDGKNISFRKVIKSTKYLGIIWQWFDGKACCEVGVLRVTGMGKNGITTYMSLRLQLGSYLLLFFHHASYLISHQVLPDQPSY